MAKLIVTWKRSAIGRNYRQGLTIRALGLRKLNQTVVHQDTPQIRGMIRKVEHLVEWTLEE
ncbi:50S ribosomal protein L30 [Thermanaerovibrio acidaminovorans]|jgi:large subunit ribosomal protein L30|uniref:50S ribosomal protein L30 n=1 Tax=Thermanaerovibrio acidaminovorans (strain ATCC 49978 / DSM 6589 / Su883) TaxID=525903 RepID=D1B5V7_THEAS|nr:50S ribosomal protein L30 [Thermanaerovibrio acidaminovorans]ACZ19398.1 ribosomal protein L30 [Thermanaerovibrio acidaminovorans DSM 6589]